MYELDTHLDDTTITYYLTENKHILAVARYSIVYENYIKLLWFENFTYENKKPTKGLGRRLFFKSVRDIKNRFPHYKVLSLYPTRYNLNGKKLIYNNKLVNFYKRLGFMTFDEYKKNDNKILGTELTLFSKDTLFFRISLK
jgi:hypothetical protein